MIEALGPEYVLLASVVAVLYGLFLALRLTFHLIDRRHDRLRLSESRNHGTRPEKGKGS